MDLHDTDTADLPQVDLAAADAVAEGIAPYERMLALFGDGEIVSINAPDAAPASRQRPAGEFFFDPMGPKLVERGWSVFPQARGDRRGPGLVDGHPLQWKAYASHLPTDREVRWWALQCPAHNVAAIMGEASGGALALDLDIADAALSREAQRLADRILGVSEFGRVGRAPRVALLYRQDLSLAPHLQVQNRAYRFVDDVDAEGLPREIGGVEILARGKPITFYGNHHKTGRYFSWAGLHPVYHGPEALPLVTADQVEAFIEALAELRPFARRGRVADIDTRWTFDAAAGLHAPRAVAGDEWSVDEAGLVNDGRAGFLFALARNVVRSNEAAAQDEERGRQALCALVEERFRALAVVDGRWAQDLRAEVAGVVARCVAYALEKATTGRYFRSPTSVDPETGVSYFAEDVAVEVAAEKAPDLAWVEPAVRAAATKAGQKRLPPMAVIPATEASKAAAALMPREERHAAGQEVSRQVRAHVRDALAFGYEVKARGGWRSADGPMPLHALVAPTGAGKTVAVVKEVIALRRENPGTHVIVGVIVPSHANAAEVAAAAERELQEAVDLAEAAGLRTLHFKGRVTSGCGFAPQMEAVYAAGMPGSRLCKSSEKDAFGETVTTLCPLYDACAYRRQLAALKAREVDLVLLPHSTLTGHMPAELLDALDVRVIDESAWKGIVGTAMVPERVLLGARPEPAVSKKEREPKRMNGRFVPGLTPGELIRDRDDAVRVLLRAREDDVDPATAFLRLSRREGLGWKDVGLDFIASARRCASSSFQAGAAIKPGMSMEDVERVTSGPRTEAAAAEAAMWGVIADRLKALIEDRTAAEMHAAATAIGANVPAPARKAGGRDRRIQFRLSDKGEPAVRVSWRREQNWSHLPTLLIDASLSARITAKLWPGRALDIRRVDAPIHLRTILVADGTGSDAAVLPLKAGSAAGRVRAAERLDLWLAGVARMEGLYANGGVLVSSSQAVRVEAEACRTLGPNSDYLHQGNTRGFDFAKNHSVLYSYGRMEAPPSVIDAYAAAFTYDDDEPETPWDVNGDGTAADGKGPLKPPSGTRRVLMRDGTFREYADLLYPEGSWAREIQNQLREEELRQTVGRLRPVFRVDSDAVWVNVSRCVPEGIVVDEIVSLGDLVRPGGKADHLFEAARRMHGVLAPSSAHLRHPDLVLYRAGDADPLTRLSERERAGTVRVRYRIRGHERPVERLLLNNREDLEGSALSFAAQGGHDVVPGSFETVGERPERTPIGHKAPDRLDRARSAIPHEAQEAILAEADGAMLLRDALRLEGMRREEAARRESMEAVTRELGRVPTDWHSLPAQPGMNRSEARVRLSQRVILDRARAEGGDAPTCAAEDEA